MYFTNLLSCRYLTISSELLNSVKKMEDSLKRLKALRRTSEVAIASSQQGSVSDDDKIRMQLKLDVNFYGKEVGVVDCK